MHQLSNSMKNNKVNLSLGVACRHQANLLTHVPTSSPSTLYTFVWTRAHTHEYSHLVFQIGL